MVAASVPLGSARAEVEEAEREGGGDLPPRAGTVAFLAPGEAPSRAARRAVLGSYGLLEDRDDLAVLSSQELRRALAGLPAAGEGDDPLSDVRQLVRESGGDGRRDALARLGQRLDVDLLITVRQAGEELEVRAFDVARGAFYRGTLMLPALAEPDEDELSGFVLPRARAASAGRGGGGEDAEPRAERPARRSIWSQWWMWVIVGGVVAAAAVVGYVATPTRVEDTGVTLDVVVP